MIRKDTEREWVEAAAGKTVREIETMVSGRKPGDRPTDRPDPKLVRHGVHFDLRAEQLALYRKGRSALAAKLGHGVDDADVLEAAMRALLAECAADDKKADGSRSPYEIALTMFEIEKPPLPLDDNARALTQTLTKMGFDRATARAAVERVAHPRG